MRPEELKSLENGSVVKIEIGAKSTKLEANGTIEDTTTDGNYADVKITQIHHQHVPQDSTPFLKGKTYGFPAGQLTAT